MQIEMFAGSPKYPPLFVVQGHFAGSYQRLSKTLWDYTFMTWFGGLVLAKEKCSTHGEPACKELRCMLANEQNVPAGVCNLCKEEVVLVRRGEVFIASGTCTGRKQHQARRAPRKPGPGVVYFIHDPSNAAVKIGYSASDPRRRLRTLQVGHPTKLVLLANIPGDMTTESEMHARFAAQSMRGEWFKLAGGLRTFLRRQGASV